MYTVKQQQLGNIWDWFNQNITISKGPTGPIKVTVGQQNPPPAPPPTTVMQQPQQGIGGGLPIGGIALVAAIALGVIMLGRR